MRLFAFGLNSLLSIILALTPIIQGRGNSASTPPVRVDGFGVEMSAMPSLTLKTLKRSCSRSKKAALATYVRRSTGARSRPRRMCTTGQPSYRLTCSSPQPTHTS